MSTGLEGRKNKLLLTKDTFIANMHGIQKLFERAFNKCISREYLMWRYIQNYLNITLSTVHYEENRIIANYSVSAYEIYINGEKCRAAVSMTAMTDPDYHGKGLMPQLGEEMEQYLISENYKLLYCFPNRNTSHAIFTNKMAWVDIYELPTMRMNISNFKDIDDGLVFDNIFQYQYPETVDSCKELNHVIKTTDYLKWRYLENPQNEYTNIIISRGTEVTSYCIVKKFGNSLDIVDFQAKNRDEGECLIRQAVSFAVINNLEFINCWAPRHHFMHSICERIGFKNHEPITYLTSKSLDSSLSDNVYNYGNWFIQMGDSDVY